MDIINGFVMTGSEKCCVGYVVCKHLFCNALWLTIFCALCCLSMLVKCTISQH